MRNRYRVSPKQFEFAGRHGFDISKLSPEPDPLPPPELFPKRWAYVVRKENGERLFDFMQRGVPLNAKPVTSVPNHSPQLAQPFPSQLMAVA